MTIDCDEHYGVGNFCAEVADGEFSYEKVRIHMSDLSKWIAGANLVFNTFLFRQFSTVSLAIIFLNRDVKDSLGCQ